MELTSVLFDVYPFIPYLNRDGRLKLLTLLQGKVESRVEQASRGRAVTTLWKAKKVLGLLGFESSTD